MNLEVSRLSWISDLYLTYESNLGQVAKDLDEKAVLLPVAHSTQNAQIEVVINDKGDFLSADKVDKSDAVTVIPVTEDSATRSSGNTPHPLEDKLIYIAGDYMQYTGIDNNDKYEKYLSQLKDWNESAYSNFQVNAIYTYLSNAVLIQDLIKYKVLEEEQGQLTDAKIEGIAQKEAFVRFRVEPVTAQYIGREKAVYKDANLFNLYTQYYVSTQGKVDLCYASGKFIPCSIKHPAKVRHSGDKAKLISANDSSGFTYRGRFSDNLQIASIGYETSQKAHNALRWLIGKQGFSIGEMVIVAWEISGKSIISPTQDTEESFFGDEYEAFEFTNDTYARKLKLAARGYQQSLSTIDSVVVIGLEAATTGRLSVSFYKKMMSSDFMDRILEWHSTCFWKHRYKKDEASGSYYWFVGAPSPKDIAVAAFGDKNEKLIKSTVERLLPCIIDKRKIPKDIVKAAVVRASNPNGFDNKYMYNKAVSIACALVRKSRFDYKGEEWEMALDRENRDRSYVFGRLLGAAQKLEEVALFYSGEQSRSTAAERFGQQFVRRPGKTWKIINDNLRPYTAKMKAMGKTWYVKELQDIYELIDEEDFKKQEPLSEVYLLGYNCQLNSYDKKEGKIKNDTNEGEDKE